MEETHIYFQDKAEEGINNGIREMLYLAECTDINVTSRRSVLFTFSGVRFEGYLTGSFLNFHFRPHFTTEELRTREYHYNNLYYDGAQKLSTFRSKLRSRLKHYLEREINARAA